MRTTKRAAESAEDERTRLRPPIGSGTTPARPSGRARVLLMANRAEGGPDPTPEHKMHNRAYQRAPDGAAEARLVALARGARAPTADARITLGHR